MNEYLLYAGGEFINSVNKLEVIEPFTDKVFAYTYLADNNILEKAILKAQSIEQEMKEMPSYKKYSILMDIAHQLKDKERQIAGVLAREAAKPLKYAISEVKRAIQTFIVAAEECKRLPSEYISLDWTPAGEKKEGLVKYFPVGLVAGISPFNFPLNLAVHKIAAAIAAGCPILLKPASSTPLSTLELAKIIDNTQLPKGAFSVLPMNRQAGNKLVTDERFKLLTFTGSPEVGWKMKADAGKKRVVLELGGNAACIITETADLKNAVKKSLIGAFAYSGQVCIHAQRFYVHESIFEQFLSEFVKGINSLIMGNPMDVDTDFSVMIDEENAKRVELWVNEAIEKGAELVCGGKREGSFYEPTILSNTNGQMKVNTQEIFGPVITIEKYKDFDRAIDFVNDSNYGLQAGVFTNNINEMNYAFNNIDTGGVITNDVPTFRVDHMPYGGIKESGFGREGIKYAIHDMLEPKILVKNC